MFTASRIAIAALVTAGLAILVAWGLHAALVYLVLAVLAGGLAYAGGVGGDWLRESSRGRFERDRRR